LNIDSEGLNELLIEVNETGYKGMDEHLFKALKALTEEQLLLVEMRFFEKKSFSEIGEILSISENNAKVKLYRSLDKLKPLLKKN
jgi:RNA polymerase sigma-70 factor (ECF subfamily)